MGFELSDDGQGGIKAKIFDVESPLQMHLDSQFNLAGNYSTQGDIELRPNAPREIAEMLNSYTSVSKDIQEALSLFVESKGRDAYSIRWKSIN